MAVQEQTPLQEYTANGITKQFDLEFDCESADHLIVSIDDLEVLHTDWYLSGNAIMFHVAPASGKQVKIQRNTPFNRLADYQSYNNSFRPPVINKDFDRIWWKLQELGVADWILSNRISALKAYVDDRDDELRAYLMEEIRKQGVALDQLDEYYNYLMERLAQIAVDKGWDASFVVDSSGKTQQEINNSLKLKTFEDLKAFNPNFDKQTVHVGQRSDTYIHGGGLFYADLEDTTSVDNDGTILVGTDGTRWKRRWNTHADPCWFGADYTGEVDCSPQVQKAVDVSYGRVWFGNADRSFKMTTPVGLPTNSLVGEMIMEICGAGARIWVYSDTGVFTSKRSIGFETSTDDLYTAVLEFGRGLRFQGDGTSQSVVINGDRLYNVNMKGGRYLRISALVKATQPRRTEATGYVQSVTVEGNHLGLCNRIIDSKRGFNINVNRNFGESCYGGIYVDGDNSPAINVIRCEGNLWESSGVFAKLGSVYAGTFIGNYFEGNSAGDIPTMKCLIELGKTGTTAYSSGVSFIGNQFGAATAYKTDTAYIDVKFTSSFSGTSLDTLQPPVFIGNWTNGYRMWSEGQVVTQFGNAFSGGNSRRHLAPKLHTEARVTFDLSRKEFLSSTYLVGGVHTVCELETSFISNLVSQTARSCSADLNIFMQMKNANNVVLGAAVAKVSLVVQGSEGVGTGATTDVYVGASLTGFTQLTSGVIDTVNNVSLQQHFTNTALTIERVGTKYLLKLSGFTAPSAGVYGSSSKVYSNSTMMIYSLNSGASFAGQLVLQ